MPPKKDNKKKGGGSGPKEIDPDAYIRQPVQLPDLSADRIGADEALTGTYYGIASQFGEWSIDGESWDAPVPEESLIPIKYPPVVKAVAEKSIIELLKLNAEVEGAADAGKKGKKEAPKKGKGPAEVTEELAYDEHGRALPRVFVDSASAASAATAPDGVEAAGNELLRPFRRSAAEDDTYMSEVDPLICATFELVKRYSTTVLANSECPFLWRAIYPQLPSGRPCFNPSGRYCVKLFVAGAWRKVYVTDSVPITESGEPAVASSSAPQELWPMLLAKAIYTVMTAIGYHTLFESLGLANAAPSATDKAAAFVAFALSLLTGWLPTAPMAVPIGTDEDRGSFLQDIAFGGCRCIALEDQIRSKALSTDEIEVDESVYEGKLTKKIIRDLQETKLVRREHLKKVVCKREGDIRATVTALGSVHAELFCLVLTNPEGTLFRVYPVLSIASKTAAPPVVDAYTPGSPTSTRLAVHESNHLSPVKLPRPTAASEPSQIQSVQLLVDWALLGPRPTGLGSDEAQGSEEEWATSTELRQKWVPFTDFCNSMTVEGHEPYGVSVISFETRSRASLSQQMHWSWAAPVDAAPDAVGKGKAPAKPAGKDKKGVATESSAALTALGVPIAGRDQGVFPPTFLSIDVSSILNVNESAHAKEAVKADLDQTEGGPSVQVVEHAIGGVEKPDPAQYLAVMVHLQGEVVASLNGTEATMMADSVVLVLQEIRADEEEPLVMRVALSPKEVFSPITRTTFHIPIQRIRHSPNGGKLTFWVRLFTRASVCMTFASACPVILGAADTVWQSSEEGVATVIDGESGVIRSNIEAVLLRASFLAPDTSVAPPAGGEADPGATDDFISPTNLTSSYVAGSRVMVFFHVSDRRASNFISLIGLSGGVSDECIALPRLCGDVLQMTPAVTAAGPLPGQVAMGIVARIFLAKDSLNLSGFKWKMILLSRKVVPLTNRWISVPPLSAGPTIPSAIKRFGGCYTPNNKLVLFRDQLAGLFNEAPLALRISVLPFTYGESGNELSVWMKVRLINPNNRAVVREYRGRGVIPIYAVDLKQFAAAEGEVNTAVADKKGKKDDKKGAKGASAEETISFIVECVLDEDVMEIPVEWRSRFPYTYSGLLPSRLADDASAQPKLVATQASVIASEDLPKYLMPNGAPAPETQGPEWVLDVIGGSVASAAHDLYDLSRFKDTKNSWLEKSSDRFERAAAAVAYNAARLMARNEADEDEIVGLLAVALDSTTDVLNPTEALRPEIPAYKEFMTVLDDYKIPALVGPQTEEQKERLSKEAAGLDNEAQSSIDALTALNCLIKEDVIRRMEDSVTTIERYNGELREAWQERDKARLYLNNQNASLTYLLGRVAEAKSKVFEPEEDPKKKGKKK